MILFSFGEDVTGYGWLHAANYIGLNAHTSKKKKRAQREKWKNTHLHSTQANITARFAFVDIQNMLDIHRFNSISCLVALRNTHMHAGTSALYRTTYTHRIE